MEYSEMFRLKNDGDFLLKNTVKSVLRIVIVLVLETGFSTEVFNFRNKILYFEYFVNKQ
jgi:hypothetical protein